MPETEKRNQLLGEAICIRAFCYLNLIRIYGDVPGVYTPEEVEALFVEPNIDAAAMGTDPKRPQ